MSVQEGYSGIEREGRKDEERADGNAGISITYS